MFCFRFVTNCSSAFLVLDIQKIERTQQTLALKSGLFLLSTVLSTSRRMKLNVLLISVVNVSYLSGSQSETRCISLKSLSTNQIAGFAHLHKQNGDQGENFFLNQSEGRMGSRHLSRAHHVFGDAGWIEADVFFLLVVSNIVRFLLPCRFLLDFEPRVHALHKESRFSLLGWKVLDFVDTFYLVTLFYGFDKFWGTPGSS